MKMGGIEFDEDDEYEIHIFSSREEAWQFYRQEIKHHNVELGVFWYVRVKKGPRT